MQLLMFIVYVYFSYKRLLMLLQNYPYILFALFVKYGTTAQFPLKNHLVCPVTVQLKAA